MFIILGFKILFSLIEGLFLSKSLKKALGYAILFQFIKAVESSNIIFLNTSQDRKKIISSFVNMSRLVDNALESEDITVDELEQMISDGVGYKNKHDLIYESIIPVRYFASKSQHYDYFVEDIKESWRANKLRCSSNVSNYDHLNLESINNKSGGKFFTALVHLLNPKGLPPSLLNTILLCGGWFQVLDDYRDRKKDVVDTTTLFTLKSDRSSVEILIEQSRKYEKGIINLDNKGYLVEFMKELTTLIRTLDFTKNIVDW